MMLPIPKIDLFLLTNLKPPELRPSHASDILGVIGLATLVIGLAAVTALAFDRNRDA